MRNVVAVHAICVVWLCVSPMCKACASCAFLRAAVAYCNVL